MRESDCAARLCEWLSSVFPEFRVPIELEHVKKFKKDSLNKVKDLSS